MFYLNFQVVISQLFKSNLRNGTKIVVMNAGVIVSAWRKVIEIFTDNKPDWCESEIEARAYQPKFLEENRVRQWELPKKD